MEALGLYNSLHERKTTSAYHNTLIWQEYLAIEHVIKLQQYALPY